MLEPWLARPRRSDGNPGHGYGSAFPRRRVVPSGAADHAANHSHSPQNFFLEAVQATNVRAEDRIVELIKVDVSKQPACRVVLYPR